MKAIRFLPLLVLYFSPAIAAVAPKAVDVRALPDVISVRMYGSAKYLFDQDGERLFNPRPIAFPKHQPTVMLQLNNSLGGGVSGITTALVTSKYDNVVHFRCAARFKGQPGFVETGEYKVNRKDPTAVRYQEPIEEFAIWDLRLSDQRK